MAVRVVRGRLHDGAGVDGRRVAAQRVADVAGDVALGDEVEEEQVLEALERDGAQRRQPQQQRREAALVRAVRAPAVLVQAREHLRPISLVKRYGALQGRERGVRTTRLT